MTTAPLPLRTRIGHIVTQVIAARATWVFAAAWLLSALVLVVSGYGFPVFSAVMAILYLLFCLLTVAITEPNPPVRAVASERPRLWLQLGIIAVFIVLTALGGLAFHGVLPDDFSVPLWSPLVKALEDIGGNWFGNDNYLANPVKYFVLPLIALLLAGARFRGLGFARGHRVGRVLLLWGAPLLAYFVYALVSGQTTLTRLASRLVSNFMQNGFFEEFLFRGALQTRLRLFTGAGWALVLQALLFGVWHLGLGFTNTGHAGLLPATASTIVNQAVIGLAFGVLFERTRNLLMPSIVHILINTLG